MSCLSTAALDIWRAAGLGCESSSLFPSLRCFLRHEDVAHGNAPIEVAEICRPSESSQLVVFLRLFPVMLGSAQKVPHTPPHKPSPSSSFHRRPSDPVRRFEVRLRGGRRSHCRGPAHTKDLEPCTGPCCHRPCKLQRSDHRTRTLEPGLEIERYRLWPIQWF
jgi:hypothetical protein